MSSSKVRNQPFVPMCIPSGGQNFLTPVLLRDPQNEMINSQHMTNLIRLNGNLDYPLIQNLEGQTLTAN